VLGLQKPDEALHFFADRIVYYDLSMRSHRIG